MIDLLLIWGVLQGGHVRGSHNLYAQTFYDELPSVFEQFRDTEKVIFYCQSSNGRGPRCAGWYVDLSVQPSESSGLTLICQVSRLPRCPARG